MQQLILLTDTAIWRVTEPDSFLSLSKIWMQLQTIKYIKLAHGKDEKYNSDTIAYLGSIIDQLEEY